MSKRRLLIISPYFPPSNAADAQRVRMSLPFYPENGWEAEVVMVDSSFSEMVQDPLSEQTIPSNIKIHKVPAFNKRFTSKVGLGSIGLRSLWFYRKYVDKLLINQHFDLIFFSTTQFPVCILGSYWQKKFGVPFVIDMQDPWHSTYYLDKPASQRPPKYWFTYRLHKYLEPMAMKYVGGLISVSEKYLEMLNARYKRVAGIPQKVITFGYLKKDVAITENNWLKIRSPYEKKPDTVNIVYVGRGGFDMQPSGRVLFQAFSELLSEDFANIKKLKFHFIGTSYAPENSGKPTFSPLASELNIEPFVEEQTTRITFYESIKALLSADGLMVFGSNDPAYTASKIYPYILANKPLVGLFHRESSAYKIIEDCNAGLVVDFNELTSKDILKNFLADLVTKKIPQPSTNWEGFSHFSAEVMTKQQCSIFDSVVNKDY